MYVQTTHVITVIYLKV